MSGSSRIAWWVLLAVCVFYGLFGLVSGVSEGLSLLGLIPEPKPRATPLAFVVHALAGGIALLAGPLQLHPAVRARTRVHRTLGLMYVAAVWMASVFAIADAAFFAVTVPSKLVFAAFGSVWFVATTLAFRRAREHRYAAHREWMLRSFALTFFAVTFSVWVPALAATALPPTLAYPLALLLSGGVNLAVAEAWIRRTRATSSVVDIRLRAAA